MFLGYNRNQKGELFISLVADTEQELKNYPCVSFEKIEETKDKYILYNGKYLKETDIDVNENICAQRADRFYQETDKFLFKKLENVIDIPSFLDALKLWRAEKEKIRKSLPYVKRSGE